MRRPPVFVFLTVMASAAICAAPALAQPARPARPSAPARPAAARPATGPAAPASPGGPAAPTARPLTLREAIQRLQSTSDDDVSTGITELTRIGSAEVIPPLVELVHRGVADDVLETVVDKFGIIGRPEAIDELSSLLHHRRPSVREMAVRALGQIRDNRVRALIESGLRDSDGAVRGAAAVALGEIGARQSIELLQRAFERNVPEAAESIGRLGDAGAADRLLEAVGRAPLSVLLPGFRRFLDRRDLTDPVKLRIVEQVVNRSPTVQVRAFLQEWVASLPPAFRSPSRQRAELAIRQIHDNPAPPAAGAAPQAPAGGAR